ncbi:MAG: ATP-binding domain-containing protein, partial [Lachnospiraceae bacterium]|nr:ATP-binding domain-containing protein [Lachnospiraceae bacterium]
GGRRKDLFVFLEQVRGYDLKREYFPDEGADLKRAAKIAAGCGDEEGMQCIEKLETNLGIAAGLDYFGVLKFYLSVMGAEKKCRMKCGRDTEKMKRADEAIEALFAIDDIPGIGNGAEALGFFDEYEKSFLELPDKESVQARPGEVSIMTYHGAKGLEFDNVYIPGVISRLVPKGNILTKDELREERRMFYVAMTRAKKTLTISYFGDGKGRERSVFIEELS